MQDVQAQDNIKVGTKHDMIGCRLQDQNGSCEDVSESSVRVGGYFGL